MQYVPLGHPLEGLGLLAFSQLLRFNYVLLCFSYVNETNLKIGTSNSTPFEIESEHFIFIF